MIMLVHNPLLNCANIPSLITNTKQNRALSCDIEMFRVLADEAQKN